MESALTPTALRMAKTLLVGCFRFENYGASEYFSLYLAIPRERANEERNDRQMKKKISKQPPPAPPLCGLLAVLSAIGLR